MKLLITVFLICLSTLSTSVFSQQGKARLSVSGKPQDEAMCGLLGERAGEMDRRCILKQVDNTVVSITYVANYEFGLNSTESESRCASHEFAKPLLAYLSQKKIKHQLLTGGRQTCSFAFKIDKKEDLCSAEGMALFKKIGMSIYSEEHTKSGRTHKAKFSWDATCK